MVVHENCEEGVGLSVASVGKASALAGRIVYWQTCQNMNTQAYELQSREEHAEEAEHDQHKDTPEAYRHTVKNAPKQDPTGE